MQKPAHLIPHHFPSFSEGLSLRQLLRFMQQGQFKAFPFLFGGTFIEAAKGGVGKTVTSNFPSFSEGLSLRLEQSTRVIVTGTSISLPFRRDFH